MDKSTLIEYSSFLKDYFITAGMNATTAGILNSILVCIVIGVIVVLLDILFRKTIIQIFRAFGDKNSMTFDDYLMRSNFPRFAAHYLPLGILWYILPIILQEYNKVNIFINKALSVYIIVLSILVIRSFLRSVRDYLQTKPKYYDKPLQSYVQVVMIFAWGAAVFFIVNSLTDFNILSVTTLGATSAIILLIFKDTILGVVASIQVSVNDIVRIGDWITFSKFGADGYVTEINLATVKVQNFDHTYTTIPTYSLIADSFQNWRGMQESKGRRIKRALFIKQNSIKFLSKDDLVQLNKIALIAPYLKHREKELETYNTKNNIDKDLLINGRNQTNLGVFRNYAESFLSENEKINQDLFLMVRHLAPTDKGIPIEVFCFTYDKKWQTYEYIQSDIFDHLIAAVPYFGLELFESPTGNDLAKISFKE